MRLDHQAAASNLSGALQALLDVPVNSNHLFVSLLYRLTQLLFDHPLVRAVVDDTGRPPPGPTVEARLASVIFARGSGPAERLQGHLATLVSWAERSSNLVHLRLPRGPLGMTRQVGTQEVSVLGAVDLLADEERFARLTGTEVAELSNLIATQVNAFTRELGALPENERVAGQEALRLAQEVLPEIIRDPRIKAANAQDVLNTASTAASVRELRVFHDEMSRLGRAEAPIPFPPDYVPLMSEGTLRARYQWPARVVTHEVLRKLTLGAAVGFGIVRLRTYFEHFGTSALVARLSTENDRVSAAGRGRRQFEALIQDEVDRFLFEEGFFPITHASAVHGAIDTFCANELPHWFAEVARTEDEPVLLELKQAVTIPAPGATRTEVVSAIEEGLDQVEIYRRQLVANPSWARHQPHAVVFYNGPTRFVCDDEDAVLVYVGDARPHAGTTGLGRIRPR